ncbi:two-component system OmpR family response regulator [Streptomyces sp. SAI-208]|uniref:response regulator transcription factor n=1 Tax=unclassified Streptomyces TaxID=2593676 RepID=UPI00247701F8|nr:MULTISPECIES: response regulator transcription factor [unclassified Streptomyces]MDH6546397.1 two-component system OmpR family response regulator [Streptomyces sp. SAI-041]MDH6565496.1 two-component system OmpR family response regulator [Streptomyces sp. SAI-117]MDH6589586.1 two-component system OmpR family response regulator [Streptomyces sp. SAI-133]MDH6605059.1 two-component system OmpR family response regulator [Streptomyces sp. SAI-208]
MNAVNTPATADRVLVVDDDPGIRSLLISALQFAGFDVETAGDLSEALDQVARRPPDVIVLDVMLPGADGFEILQLLRSRAIDVPVLFLTARDAVEDRVRGLRLGGDDYVTKPFSVVEVGARLQALLRRARGGTPAEESRLSCDDLTLDDLRHEVRRGGRLVELSPTEYRLLHYLLSHQGQVLSRAQILEAVWQYDFGGDSVVVERFVSNLRRKIDHGRTPLLRTVRGVGYTLRKQDDT